MVSKLFKDGLIKRNTNVFRRQARKCPKNAFPAAGGLLPKLQGLTMVLFGGGTSR
jgi:hypothetical protein